MEIAVKCPFLSRVSTTIFATSRGTAFFDKHARLCPVFSRVFTNKSMSETESHQEGNEKLLDDRRSSIEGNNCFDKNSSNEFRCCPFLGHVSLSPFELQVKSVKIVDAAKSNNEVNSHTQEVYFSKDNSINSTNSSPSSYTHDDSPVMELNNSKNCFFNYPQFYREKIALKKKDHSYRVFKEINRSATHFPEANCRIAGIGNNNITVWCSNDYMGMSRHPKVIRAVQDGLDRYGAGAGGTRNISGTNSLHRQLESQLAQWHGKEAGLLFNSCYLANETAISTLAQHMPDCELYSDAANHASIIQGIRLSRRQKFIFRHNDPDHLEELLSKSDKSKPKLVIFESVHSMNGSISPIKRICDIARKYGAMTFLDEVHAIGLYGRTGAGIVELEDIVDHVDFISGTLAKAIGNIGGYIVADADAIDTLRSYCPGFIFTTSLPPATIAGCLASIDVLRSEQGRSLRTKLHSNVSMLFNKLRSYNIPAVKTPSHIIPVHVGNAEDCSCVSNDLLQKHNIYVQSINYPTVPVGQEQLRITTTPLHTESMMDHFVDALISVWKKHNIPFLWSVCNKYDNCYCSDKSASNSCRYQEFVTSRDKPINAITPSAGRMVSA